MEQLLFSVSRYGFNEAENQRKSPRGRKPTNAVSAGSQRRSKRLRTTMTEEPIVLHSDRRN